MFTPVLQNYAFGWAVRPMKLDDDKTEVATIAHNGGINGFNTVEIRMPDTQDLVVLFDNTSRGDKLDAAAKGVIDILHNIEAPAPKASLVDELMKTLAAGSARDAIARYRELKAKSPQAFDYSEQEVNRLGYTLLQRNRVADAIDIFLLNVEENPKSWNVYDSLGEAYAAHGDRDLAIANYKKSLELNPKNTNGADALKRLESPPAKIDTSAFDKYVGTYELAPGFNIVITKEGDKMYAQATGQERFEIFPDSTTDFHWTVVPARLTFAPDGSSLTLHQGGRDVPGKRVK